MDIAALVKASPPIPTEHERELFGTGAEKLSKLTLETTEALLDAVADGLHPETAAKVAGVAPRTVRGWVSKAEEDIEAGHPSEYVTFLFKLYQAETIVESSAVSKWKHYFEGDKGDWRAIATFLERRFPERWGKKSEVKHSGQVVHGVVMLPEVRRDLGAVDHIEGEVIDSVDQE